jgi:hypothetical protein
MSSTKHYLTNREILKEIHNSKMSYCWLLDQKYHMYDTIINQGDTITDSVIQTAKEERAANLSRARHEAEVARWTRGELTRKTKPRAIDFAVDPSTISIDDIVVREMTYDHIPLEARKTNPKTIADNHSRCNFPAFKHWAWIDDKWTEVARSHWKGDLTDGKFCITHGRTNERLAFMYMKLCERYAQRSNWRGYTYVDEMRGNAILQLTQIGLQFNESKSNNPFAYYTAAITNSFTGVINKEKRAQNIRDDLLEKEGLDPSFTRTFNAEWEGIQNREGLESFYGPKKTTEEED